MASVYTRVPAYVPTQEEIEARKAEINAKRLTAFDEAADAERREESRIRTRLWRQRMKAALKTVCGKVPVGPDGPQEMTKADICNVEFINARDLDDIFDGIIEAASFQHALEDCECRWNVADVDHDLMDLSDLTPMRDVAWQLPQRGAAPYRSKAK
jgi:hypothetical protein